MSGQHLHAREVFVVDDEAMIRDMLATLLAPEGYRVTCFADGDSFLAAARARTPACILLDVNLPGRSGLELLRELDAPRYPAPVLIVSGQRDIATAVCAIKQGALDFIEKPFENASLVARVRDAVANWKGPSPEAPAANDSPLRAFAGWERLTKRERDVLTEIASGKSSKEAGRELRISPRTIEVHRARIMQKLQAKNAADLVRRVLGPEGGHSQ